MRNNWLLFATFLIFLISCGKAPEKTKRGFQYLAQNKEISALNAFNEALADDPDHPRALLGVAILMSRNPLTYSIAYRKVRRALQNLDDKKDRKKAYEIFAKITDANENYKENQKVLSKCIKEEKIESEEVLYYLARAYREEKLYKNANEILEKYAGKNMKKMNLYHAVILAQDLYWYKDALKKAEIAGLPDNIKKIDDSERKKYLFFMQLYYKNGMRKKAVHLVDTLILLDKEREAEYKKIKLNIKHYGYRFTWQALDWNDL